MHGVLTHDGLFEGKVVLPHDQFVIERASRYFSQPKPFHSVIYKHSDVQLNHLHSSICNSDKVHKKVWLAQKDTSRDEWSMTPAETSPSSSPPWSVVKDLPSNASLLYDLHHQKLSQSSATSTAFPSQGTTPTTPTNIRGIINS